MATPFADEVFGVRRQHAAVFTSRKAIYQFIDDLVELLFPHLSADAEYISAKEIDVELEVLERDLQRLLRSQESKMSGKKHEISGKFFEDLPELYRRVWLDARAIHEGDPASESIDEVISAYPGFFAIFTYRVAHALRRFGVPLLPRIFTEYAHVRTGIDIHPGATIGERFCIDHGTGVVIGETTRIGNNVKVYQGVSLGALSVSKELSRTKRHPTVEDNVVIYSSATILGGKTVIGHDSVIGGNVWLTQSVAPYSVVYHKNEIHVRSKKMEHQPLDFNI